MAPEYGATCGFFPTDEETINYFELSGKNEDNNWIWLRTILLKYKNFGLMTDLCQS